MEEEREALNDILGIRTKLWNKGDLLTRERKIRGWHIKEKRMFNVHRIDFDKQVVYGEALSKYSFNEVILTENTGRKDKNDKMIYNGDWLRMINGTTGEDVYEFVEWLPNEMTYGLFKGNGAFANTLHDGLRSQQGFSYEVIGNVFQNLKNPRTQSKES